jgi:hypothetical protein
MNRFLSIILMLLLLTASCKKKQAVIEKFIYFRVSDLVYDSVGKPYLGIILYLQYNMEGKTLMSLGKFYERESIAPPNGLNSFYELNTDIKINELLDKTFINKSFDSTYNDYFEPRCFYFLYETSDKRTNVVTFGEGAYPNSIRNLRHYLDSLISKNNLWTPTKPFFVDSLFIDYERNLFTNYPPPPKPMIR